MAVLRGKFRIQAYRYRRYNRNHSMSYESSFTALTGPLQRAVTTRQHKAPGFLSKINIRGPLNIQRAESGEKIFCQTQQKSARVVDSTRRSFVKYDGKDSVDSPCDEFLEVPIKHTLGFSSVPPGKAGYHTYEISCTHPLPCQLLHGSKTHISPEDHFGHPGCQPVVFDSVRRDVPFARFRPRFFRCSDCGIPSR